MTIILGSFTHFEQELLTAAYYTSNNLGRDSVTIGEIGRSFEIDLNPRWLKRALSEWHEVGVSKERLHNGGLLEQSVWLSAEGLRKAEALLEGGFKPRARDGSPDDDLNRPTDNTDPADPQHSTDWTGLAAKIDGTRLVTIKQQTTALLLTIDQSELDDRTKENARRHVEAVITLMDAPDPPWERIVDLLNARYLTAFLNVSAVLALIFGS